MNKDSFDYITVQEAIASLGEHGEQQLFNAHTHGKVTLVGWRRGPHTAHGPIPAEYFANAVDIEAQTNSIVPDADVTNFGEFERNYRHLDSWDDVKVKRAEIDALKKVLAAKSNAEFALAPLANETESVVSRIDAVIVLLLAEGKSPGLGGTVQWKRYCDTIRERCGVHAGTRGFGDKSIKRRIHSLKEKGSIPA